MMPTSIPMTASTPDAGGGVGGGMTDFFQYMQRMQDPYAVLGDRNASGLDKFMAVLLSAKVQAQGGGSGFGFAGPNSDPSRAMLNKFMRSLNNGSLEQSPVLTPVDRQPIATGPNLPLGRSSLPLSFDPANLGGLR